MAQEIMDNVQEKKVLSQEVASQEPVNLFRDAAATYFPKDRHTDQNPMEKYDSPSVIDLDVAMFVVPERTAYADLCPDLPITGERLRNVFTKSAGSSSQAGLTAQLQTYWGQWTADRNMNLSGSCSVVSFDDSECISKRELSTLSADKYRRYCVSEMHATKELQFLVKIPLSGYWQMPSARMENQKHKPEWTLDFQMEYQFNYDKNFLNVEKEYMARGGDYISGSPRYWAAEALIKGETACTNTTLAQCDWGIPANPPTFYPSLEILIDKDKTKDIHTNAHPRYWPSDWSTMEEVLETLDYAIVEMQTSIRALTNTEDSGIPLIPNQKIVMHITWILNPVYKVDKLGGTVLNSWLQSVKAIDVSYGASDYVERSQTTMRIIFDIDATSERLFEQYAYSLADFLTDLGSWMGLFGMGALIVSRWQKWTKPFGSITTKDAAQAVANAVSDDEDEGGGFCFGRKSAKVQNFDGYPTGVVVQASATGGGMWGNKAK
jgi:hypothetical protein